MRLFFLVASLIFTYCANAAQSSISLLEKLSEAEDYLQVKPSVSANILKQHLQQIKQLSPQDQLRWHQNLLRASITLNDLTQVEQSVRLMLAYPELDKAPDKLISVLSSLGIFMRRLGYHKDSIWLFDCGLSQTLSSNKQKLSLLVSKGISLRQLGRFADAKKIYAQALKIAEQDNDAAFKSVIHNILGIMAIYENELPLARQHLLQGRHISQRISRRSGQIITGLNLLLLSILEKDVILYQRLHYPISRLTSASKNQDRHTYLLWLEKAYQVLNGKALTFAEQIELQERLAKVKDFSLHNMLVLKLSKPLNIKTQLREKRRSQYQGDLLGYFHQCI